MSPDDCPHRRDPHPVEVAGKVLDMAVCHLLTRELDFVNSVFENQCEKCLAGRTVPPARILDTELLTYLAGRHLTARIHCHYDPSFPTYANASLGNAIEKMKEPGMGRREIGDAILTAMDRGMPADQALRLIEEHDLDYSG